MGPDVVITPCGDYKHETVRSALEQVLAPLGGLDWVQPGMKVAVKVNLLTGARPEKAATTHPAVLSALAELLAERGAEVVAGDSPGGLYNSVFVNRVYAVTGMHAVEQYGGRLNQDFSEGKAVYPEGKVCRSFRYTAWLDGADAIIDLCKLKTHGMMVMTCGAKNLFGTIPGTVKPEYHFRFPDPMDFARMIVDLDEYFKPRLTIVDAVDCMEGNGPSGGTPRHMGVLVASECPHKADLLCAKLMGLGPEDVPTLKAAGERGLIPSGAEDLAVEGDPAAFVLPDFKLAGSALSHLFRGNGKNPLSRVGGAALERLLAQRPQLRREKCVGCGVCKNVCPADAITMADKRPRIDRKKCIRCFCCQEFCPESAMIVHRTAIARLLSH